MKKIKGFKSLLAVLQVSALVLTSVFLGADSFTASAEAAALSDTAVPSAPSTKIYSTDSFTEEDFNANFTKWNNEDFGFTIEDGVLKIDESTTTRHSLYTNNTPSLNNYVSVTLRADNVATSNARPLIWLRANDYTRSQGDNVPVGYYVQVIKSTLQYTVTLNKAYGSDGNYSFAQIGKIAVVDAASASDKRGYCDITLDITAEYDEETASTVINTRAYKLNTTSGSSTLMNSVTLVDDEPQLQRAGKVGIAANNADGECNQTANFASFAYHSTDDGAEKIIYRFTPADFADNMTVYNGNTDATVNTDSLTIAGDNSNARDGAQFTEKAALNQRITATVKNPHTYDTDGNAVRTASNAVVWLRASVIKRPNGENAPYGYFFTVDFNTGNDYFTVNAYKQSLNNEGTNIVNQVNLGTANEIRMDSKPYGSTEYADITIDASITTDNGVDTVVLKVYKGSALAKTMPYISEDAKLQKPGYAGVSARTAAATFTAFKITSFDKIASAYIQENSQKDGVFFGQIITIDPSAFYQLSVLADGDFTEKPLYLNYKDSSGSQLLEFRPDAAVAEENGRYKKFTYTIDPTNATAEIQSFLGTDSSNVKLAFASVGFKQVGTAPINFDLTGFELRKINDDGTLGANLIVNADFKMGLCGWSSDLSAGTFTNHSLVRGADTNTDSRGRINYYRDGNDYNFWSKFAVDNYNDYIGDVNGDGSYDILDLVRIKKVISANGSYNLYGDMNADGLLNAADLASVRKGLLEKK